jgi:hypothetical protein
VLSAVSRGEALTQASGIKTHKLSDLEKSAQDSAANEILKKLNFSYIVESALYKFFRVGRLQGTKQEQVQKLKVETACLITARAAIACTRLKPMLAWS